MRVQLLLLVVLVLSLVCCHASDIKKKKKKGPPVYVSTVLHQWPSDWPTLTKKVNKDGLGHLSLANTGPELHHFAKAHEKKDKKE